MAEIILPSDSLRTAQFKAAYALCELAGTDLPDFARDPEWIFQRKAYEAIIALQGGSGGFGTVTSVGLSLFDSVFDVSGSPVTTAGTLAGSLKSQSRNKFFAGPVTGAAGAPTFRSIEQDDLPNR